MYVHVDLLARGLRESLLRRPFRLRRWLYVGFFAVLFSITWLIVAIGRALDHVFFPGFRKQQIEKPVFIVAPPRSGTTLTQKLLALDDERFVHVKLYQTIFPCVCYYKIFHAFGWLDDRLDGAFMRFAHWLEGRFFGGWDKTHPLRFTEPEEDDGFFVYSFVTEAIYLLFPYVDQMWEAGFSDALPPEQRRKLMRYYRSCLQRHLYANGGGRTLLSKATQFSGSVDGLLEEFPDARVITLVREPYNAIASHVSVFYPAWHRHSPEIERDSPECRAYARLAAEWYKHLFRFKDRIAPGQYHAILYRDLVVDHFREIQNVYQHFGWELTSTMRGRFGEAAGRATNFRSRHEYQLEDYGLDRAWLRRELGDILDYYQLDNLDKAPDANSRAVANTS